MNLNKGIAVDLVTSLEPVLSVEKIKQISALKQEPAWMLKARLKAYDEFLELKNPSWGPDLSQVNFEEIIYFQRASNQVESNWEKVPQKIKETFAQLGIPEAEHQFLAGVSTQFESEVVYHSSQLELEKLGVIFLDTDTALKQHPKLFKKYFQQVVPSQDNKYSALNTACWSGGSFIYVPKGVVIEKPLQSYFRINAERSGQFERTLIIIDDGAKVHYVEGCTAPIYTDYSLHAAVVEIYVGKNATLRYSTIQNWSNNVVNLVTKRAVVMDHGTMEWIDGNIGSGINMKYPSCLLAGIGASGYTLSMAVATHGQIQDAGAKMIHLAPQTKSNIISKSVVSQGGVANYRGTVRMTAEAVHSKSHIECSTLILDDKSTSDTIPVNIVSNDSSQLEHEASVSKISEEQLRYLMSRGLNRAQATELIVMGFMEKFAKELPMEYAVELNNLIKLEMEGSIG
jgi:Fe-S cluster assembly protein SufB